MSTPPSRDPTDPPALPRLSRGRAILALVLLVAGFGWNLWRERPWLDVLVGGPFVAFLVLIPWLLALLEHRTQRSTPRRSHGAKATVPMPADWDDHAGWAKYYAFERASGRPDPLDVMFDATIRLVPELRAAGVRRVWAPGCGLAIGPGLLADAGFEVVATDVAPPAIEWQRSVAQDGVPSPLLDRAREVAQMEPSPGGTLEAFIHDFRDPLPRPAVDAVVDARAIQGLVDESLARALASRFVALKPGGRAYFALHNVWGDQRDRLETAMERAGFFVPLRAAGRWHREALAATAIEHITILGRPRVPRVGKYRDEARAREAEAVLASFDAEYARRATAEAAEAEAPMSDGETRVAVLMFSTG